MTGKQAKNPKLPRRTAKALSFVFVTVLALIWLVPIIMMLVVSFMPPDQRAPRFGGPVDQRRQRAELRHRV